MSTSGRDGSEIADEKKKLVIKRVLWMMDESVELPSRPPLPWLQKLSYGVGHVLNDLCASMWFSYLLVYFHRVQNFSNVMAGTLLLIGQIADAISTPLVGFEVDRTNGFCGYGKRKSWHLVGTLCVMVSFPFIFTQCITCERSADWAKFIYYAPFVVIFQFGWAATQISHLSLIPSLTDCKNERVGLNAVRYTFTVIANCTVYGIAWLILNINYGDESDQKLTAKDAPRFMIIALTVVGIGSIFVFIFHLGTREKNAADDTDASENVDRSEEENSLVLNRRPSLMQWKHWFKELQFYQIGLLYMFTRLVCNISQIYMPMYLIDSLEAKKQQIAIIPFIIYFSGFSSSFLMKPLNKYAGRKVTYFVGVVLIMGSSVWFWFLTPSTAVQVYGPAILQGVGTTTLLITSLSMTADLIGQHVKSGAFVYGAMSFLDKLSNGVAVMLIQQFNPCVACCSKCTQYFKEILVFVPGATALAAFIVLLSLLPVRIGKLTDQRKLSYIANDKVIKSRTTGHISEGESVTTSNHYGTVSQRITSREEPIA